MLCDKIHCIFIITKPIFNWRNEKIIQDIYVNMYIDSF